MSPLTNATATFYLDLNHAAENTITEASSNSFELGQIHDSLNDFQHWFRVLSPRAESALLKHAIHEVSLSLFLLVSGLYRPAYTSLRLFLELSLAAVHFSCNRLELAEWLAGRYDIKWSVLSDPDSGLFSPRYASAFFPQLREDVNTYRAIGTKTYRELSEYVHGNPHTLELTVDGLAFNSSAHSKWLQHFRDAALVVHFAYALRFIGEVSPADLANMSPFLNETLGHIESIRARLTAVTT
jgi:hypothetical protein